MTDEQPYTEEFFGVEMYWSHYGIEEYRAMVERIGFEVVENRVVQHGYDVDDAKPERHPLIFARKSG